MAYSVNKTNGELLTTVLDGQTNTVSSSITFIGKQVINYGEIQNENILHVMENFSNSISPPNPTSGQLWWDSATKTMQVFDTTWRPVTGFTSANSAPLSSRIGDQWWDAINQQYKIYNGTSWVIVGPAFSALDSISGAIVETVYDTSDVRHVVVKLYNTGTVTAIMSKDASFTPNVAIAGFATINPGITLSTGIDAVKIYGTSRNSDLLGNLTPSQYLRSDADNAATGNVSFRNHLLAGPIDNLVVGGTMSGNAFVVSNISDRNLTFRSNVGGTLTDTLVIDGTTGLVSVAANPASSLGIAPKQYVDATASNLRSETSTAISSNVATLNLSIAATNANVSAANAAIQSLSTNKADLQSPLFTGGPRAPTAAPGTANLQIATTEFVSTAISVFNTDRIYNGSSDITVNAANLVLRASGTTVATVFATGITTLTQNQNDNSTRVATTAYSDRADKNFIRGNVRYQPTCYISNQAPDNGIGADGDLWFQYL